MLTRLCKKLGANSRRSLLIISILIGCIIQWSCAMQHEVVTPELRTQFMQDLKEGKLTLTCQLECDYSYNINFNRMIALMKSDQYAALAELVMQIGQEKDMAYFFLGYAASGLGYYEAALKYFNYSLSLYNDPIAFHHCWNESFGNLYCGGVDLGTWLPGLIAETQAKMGLPTLAGDEQGVGDQEEMDYLGDTTPIYYDEYPGAAFYPRYVPECDCIMALMPFPGNVWVNDSGAPVAYDGVARQPSQRALTAWREAMRTNRAAVGNTKPVVRKTKPAVSKKGSKVSKTVPQQPQLRQQQQKPQVRQQQQKQQKAPPATKKPNKPNG